MATQQSLETVLAEVRQFPPSPEFATAARISSLQEYQRLYRESIENPEKFWADVAEELHWFKKWDRR